ncbi:MAG: RagB/SusD family nutrient uptake outer membrane protein [Alistipes sp.]
MKKYIIGAFALLFSATACNLDEDPYTIGGDMTQQEEGASLVVTAMYNTFWSTELMKKSYMECIDMDHDHSAAPTWVMSGAGDGNITTHWSYNNPSDPFNAFYLLINRANFAIEKLPDAQQIEEVQRNQYLGEAYFLRAFGYFHLVRMYGPIPLRLQSEDIGDMARSSVTKIYKQITDDLIEASNLMQWSTSSGDWGHANKMAAKLLLARVYVTMGSAALAGSVDMNVDIKGVKKTFTTDAVAGYEDVDATECYTLAKTLCDEIIERKGIEFDYMPSFKKLWGAENVRNKEFVWGITSDTQTEYQTAHLGYYYSAICYQGRGWAGITEHAYKLYDDTDERGEDGIFHFIKQTYTTTSAYIRIPDDINKYGIAPDGKESRADGNNYYKTIFITKWYLGDGSVDNPTPNLTAPGYTYRAQDIPMLRFIEAYLLRAEALNELGYSAEALTDVDVVRTRAKATLVTGTTTDKTDVRSIIMQERALEFVQEFNRKFDLLRWGLYLKVMNATGSVRIQGSGVSISKIREPRSVLYAVPLNEINNNKLFGENNSGW